MRNKTHLWKRSLAALLSFVMLLGMMPALGGSVAMGAEATPPAKDENGNEVWYITLPITIRDFAADGMLFEYNEVDRNTFTTTTTRDEEGSLTSGFGTANPVTITDRLTYTQDPGDDETIFTRREPYFANYNPTSATLTANSYTQIYVQSRSCTTLGSGNEWWYCLITDASGNILKVLPAGAGSKATFDADMAATYTLPDGTTATPAYTVWAWRDPSNLPYYSLLAKVTEENKHQYRIGFDNGVSGSVPSTDGEALWFYLGQNYNTTVDHQRFYATSGSNITINTYDNWKRIVCDSNGQVVAVIPAGNKEDYSAYQTSDYTIVLYSNFNTTTQDTTSHITEDNMSEYQIVMPSCDVGGALFVERTVSFYEANTRGFGLLFTKASDMYHNLYDDGDGIWEDGEFTIDGSMLEDNDPTSTSGYNESPFKTVYIWDEEETVENRVSQDLYYGTIRTGLVEKQLVNGKPVYTEATVAYLADYMSKVMPHEEKTGDIYNAFHVMGAKMFNNAGAYVGVGHEDATKDLAQVLRDKVYAANTAGAAGYKLGTYIASQTKYTDGGLRTYADVETWYDAAYFLLHNTWQDSSDDATEAGSDGYGMPMSNYHSLHLVAAINEKGHQCYVFNAKYDGTTYNSEDCTIFNSPFESDADGNPIYTTATRPYSVAVAKGETDGYTMSGIELPAMRFDPLGPASVDGWQGYGQAGSGNTYGELTGANVTQDWSEYYDDTNYHMSLEGHAQFVYHQDADQYFTFTGDDDVYLFINGHRVLDIGGAHGIAKVSINVNDVAERIGLVDGETYPFDFFYLERHGTAANFGIETNIQIVDPSMTTTKTGYQNGVNTGYNGYVDPNAPVIYEFGIENKSNAEIHNLTFSDAMIGVELNTLPTTTDTETNPQPQFILNSETDWKDISVTIYNAPASDGTVTVKEAYAAGSVDAAALKELLNEGLGAGEKILIHGFKHTILDTEWQNRDGSNDFFYNIVNTTAKRGDAELTGTANWVVQKRKLDIQDFHVYEWAGKGVTLTQAELLDPLEKAAENAADPFELDYDEVTIEVSSASGQLTGAGVNKKAKLNGEGGITYIGTETGVDTFYYKITAEDTAGNPVTAVIGVAVYSYDVANNDYVLDYGLDVELNGPNFGILANDTVSLAANPNATTASTIGISGVTRTYDDTKKMFVYTPDAEKPTPVAGTTAEDGTAVPPTVTGVYGNFIFGAERTWEDEETGDSGSYLSLLYQQKDILDNTDGVIAHVQVLEEGAEELTKFTGVEMYETVITAPASVVYYEENHPGITYISAYKYKVDEDGYLLDEDDELIVFNEQNVKIVDGYLMYADDSKIQDASGNYVMVDKQGNLVDKDGKPIEDESITVKPVVIPDENGNVWIHYETMVEKTDENGDPVLDEEGNPIYVSSAGTEQSADQDQQYGYDDNYEFDIAEDIYSNGENWSAGEITGVTDLELDPSNLSALQSSVGDALNDYFGYENDLGYSGTDSNGTVNVLQVKETAEVLFFDFVGTGFEILSRTTDEQYAIVNVIVYELDENGEIVQVQKTDTAGNPVYKDGQPVMINKVVAAKPVIAESKGGDLYQVPIISIQGLDRDNYRVVVKAGTTGKVERVLYIDGIRIYGPLSDGEALEYYNPEEYLADTFEVKQMIQDGKVVYLSAGENLAGNIVFNPVLEEGVAGTGYTVIENVAEDAESVLIQAANPNEYLKMGPNNELYLDEYAVAGGETVTICNLIMCILTPKELDDNGHPYPEGARTVQIGAHRKINDTAVSDGSVYVVYGKNAEEMLDPENPNTIEIRTGTEMYYPIDVSKLEKVKLVKDGVVSEEYSYLLFLGIRESEYYDTTLALTNMKIAGYTVEPANTQFQKDIEDDNLEENVMYRSAARYFVARKALVEANNKAPEVEVNENLTITSASLKATKVYSGSAAIVTVKAGAEAQTIVVYDAQGNEVTATRCTSKVSKGVVTFTFNWNVFGTKGEALKFTIRVFDANGLASVNTEEVTVTIR